MHAFPQEWYIKIKRDNFSLLDTIKNSLKQLFGDLLDSIPGYDLLNSNQKSFMNIFFKKVNTKYSRRLMFPSHILSQLECNPKEDLLKLLHVNGAQSKQTLYEGYSHISCKVKVIEQCDPTSSDSEGSELNQCSCKFFTWWYPDSHETSICVCVPKSKDAANDAAVQSCLHKGIGVRFTRNRKGRRAAPFPPDGERKFVISDLWWSEHCDGPCIAHIVLDSLNPGAADLKSFETDSFLTMHFDDPLVVDDDTIEWFKSKDLFNSKQLKLLIGRVICDDTHHLAQIKSKDNTPKNTVWRKKDFVLKYSPFEHRNLIVLAAIFYDACEAYRNVVTATGIEFFMDLIIVNGAAKMKTWCVLLISLIRILVKHTFYHSLCDAGRSLVHYLKFKTSETMVHQKLQMLPPQLQLPIQ
jgi:hypothetical protein